MSLTLGLTGMDPATETALKAAFVEANARLGGRWALVPDAEAGHVIVDMDSMYGPMSWLRLHAAGRQVIGLTSAPRTQTDFRLGRPFDVAQLEDLLAAVARAEGTELRAAAAEPAAEAVVPAKPEPARAAAEATQPVPAPAAAATPVASAASVAAAGVAPASSPTPEAAAPAAAPTAAPVAEVPAAVPASVPAPVAAPAAAAEPAPEPAAEDAPTAMPRAGVPAAGTMAAWLQPGALHGRVRFRRSSGPTLHIDAGADAWFGPTPLKPIAAYFEGSIDPSEFEAVGADDWARETASAGEPQPLSRLRWLGGLLAGGGALLPGLDPQERFQLSKWPQTEREYPRHFRIATQMMKGPATVAEIAAASGVPEADVADFVNANLATGFAGAVVEPPPAAEEPAKPRGLLGRLRNR